MNLLVSVFPEAKALPANKEEKQKYSKRTGVVKDKVTKEIIKVYLPEIREIETEDDLISVVTQNAWSPNIFDGPRDQDNFISTDFLVLDIDDKLKIEDAEKLVEEADVTCLCMPSTSHTPEHHKFRLIFPLSRTITDYDTFEASMRDLRESFPEADPKCVYDNARFYFGCRQDDGFWYEGRLLEPTKPLPKETKTRQFGDFNPHSKVTVGEDLKELITELYGEPKETIPEVVAHFILQAHTGLPGSWTVDLNACVFVLSLAGIDYQTIYDMIEYVSPEPLSKRDITTIEKAYSDGQETTEN